MSFLEANFVSPDPKPNYDQLYEYNKVFQDIHVQIVGWKVDSDEVYGIQYFLKCPLIPYR